MPVRIFTLIAGLIYLILGICGFIPACVFPPPARSDFWTIGVSAGYGFLFGFLPTNVVHSLVYVAIGAAGVLMALSDSSATRCARLLFILTTLFVFLGISPRPISTLGGLLPLFDFNVGIHTVTAVLAWYFGYIYGYERRHPEVATSLP